MGWLGWEGLDANLDAWEKMLRRRARGARRRQEGMRPEGSDVGGATWPFGSSW